MKHIQKQQEPAEFTKWKSKKTTTKWERLYRASKVKNKLHKSLIYEQGGICCYCETKLLDDYYHVEHFVPRSLDASLTFDYNNLLCSCQANVKKNTPRTCGNAKKNTSSQNIISPLETDCESYFTFTFDGLIKGKCPRSDNTIKILNLNEPSLVKSRKNLIETFTDMLDDNKFTKEDLACYVEKYLAQDNDGNFNEFWATINFLFKFVVV